MANDDTINESFPAKDIVFDCGVCGKSLVINALSLIHISEPTRPY